MNISNTQDLTKAELERFACLQTSHTSTAVISIKADDGRTYLFATAHYLDGIHEANPAKDARGSPERLILRFTTGEVVVLGSRLERIEDRLAAGHLRGIKTIEPRFAPALGNGAIIFSITVARKDTL